MRGARMHELLPSGGRDDISSIFQRPEFNRPDWSTTLVEGRRHP
jgi:hypothetical protein